MHLIQKGLLGYSFPFKKKNHNQNNLNFARLGCEWGLFSVLLEQGHNCQRLEGIQAAVSYPGPRGNRGSQIQPMVSTETI